MDEHSVEQQIWDRLTQIDRWEYVVSPYAADDMPALGKVPAALAMSVGDSKILFASGQVSELEPVGGFERIQVDAVFLTSNGIHEVLVTVGRQEFSNPIVSWSPLAAITSVDLETSRNAWTGKPGHFSLELKLKLRSERVVRLVPGGKHLNTTEALIDTYRVIQSHAGS